MIIFQGYGFAVFFFLALAFALTDWLLRAAFQIDTSTNPPEFIALAFVVAAPMQWAFDRYRRTKKFYRHQWLFFIHIKYWAYILVGLGALYYIAFGLIFVKE